MNRGGFLKGLLGLTAAAAVSKNVKSNEVKDETDLLHDQLKKYIYHIDIVWQTKNLSLLDNKIIEEYQYNLPKIWGFYTKTKDNKFVNNCIITKITIASIKYDLLLNNFDGAKAKLNTGKLILRTSADENIVENFYTHTEKYLNQQFVNLSNHSGFQNRISKMKSL